jgi:pyruvate,water dikinase
MPSPSKESYVILFDSLRKEDVALVGGKNANLGELISFKMPVPPGFAITADGYRLHIRQNKMEKKLEKILMDVDDSDTESLEAASKKIRNLIEASPLPKLLQERISKAYDELGHKLKVKEPVVAVRSSATAEDLPGASFA